MPVAPTALAVTAPLDTQAAVSWTGSAGASSYNVYRRTATGTATLVQSNIPGTYFEDTNLAEGTVYFYSVSAVNSSGEGAKSTPEVSVTTLAPAPAESAFSATPGDSQVTLRWGASATATSYRIYRDTVGGAGGAVNYLVTGTSHTDTGLVNGTTYYYVVVPINVSGQNYSVASAGSAVPVASSSTEAPPGPPSSVTATAGDALSILNWTPVSNATTYDVFRSTSSGAETLFHTGVTGLTYTDSTATNGLTYYYKIRADNGSQTSAVSTEESDVPFVPAKPNVTATASSSLVVLTWTPTGTSYAVYRSLASGAETLLDSGLTGSTYTDASVTNGTTYFYKIQSLNAGGSSPLSAEVSAAPAGPTVQSWTGTVTYSLSGEPVQSCTVTIPDVNRPILAALLESTTTAANPNVLALAAKYNAVIVGLDGFTVFNFGTPGSPIYLTTPGDTTHNINVMDYRWPQLSYQRVQKALNAIEQLFPAHPEIANTGLILYGFSEGVDNINTAVSTYYNAQTAAITASPLAGRVLAVIHLSELDEDGLNPVVTLDASPHLFIASGTPDGNSTLNLGLDDIPSVLHDTLARGIATNQGGPLTVVNNAGGGHGANPDLLFISTWLDSVLSQRLPATLPTSAPVSLPSWQNSSSWVGTYNVATSTASPWCGSTAGTVGVQLVNNLVSSRSTYTDSRPFTWLPSQNTAATWLAYSNTGLMTAFNPVITSPTSASITLGNSLSYQITASNSPTSFNATGLPLGLSVNTTTGAITGQPFASGTTTIAISATNAQGTTNGTLTLSVTAGTVTPKTFAQWEMEFGGSGAPTATPENDGVTNLVKYLCDINPTIPMTSSSRDDLPAVGMTAVGGTDYLTLTYRQYAGLTGVNVLLQDSTDLVNWSPVNPPDLSRQIGTDSVTLDPIVQVGVKAAASGLQYIRLIVTQQ